MITTLVTSLLLVATNMNAELDTFPIGFWNYGPIEVFDEAKVQEWQDAGISPTVQGMAAPRQN